MISTRTEFSISEIIKSAWHKVKGSKAIFWQVIAVLIFFEIANNFTEQHAKDSMGLSFLAFIFSLISSFISWSLLYMGIQRAKELPIVAGMIKHGFQLSIIWRMIVVYIFMFLILLPGILMLTIPASYLSTVSTQASWGLLLIMLAGLIISIFLGLRLSMAQGFVLDLKMNPWQAVKSSFAVTKSHVLQLFGLNVVNFFIFLISIIPVGIGLIWSMPYLFITYGEVYKKLTAKTV